MSDTIPTNPYGRNPEVFTRFDMIVSMKESLINNQMEQLRRMDVLRSGFILFQDMADGNYVYNVLESESQIPKNSDGTPTRGCLNGQIRHRVAITGSGTTINLILHFVSGEAWLWFGMGPMAQLKRCDMKDWQFGISLNMNMVELEREALNKKVAVPDVVREKLDHFMERMFSVKYLFMDFQSSDLMRFDPSVTQTPGASDEVRQQFILFMTDYLGKLKEQPNAHILGYSLVATEQTRFEETKGVPDLLKPVSATFTMYHEPDEAKAGFSNLNFVLATKGGHGKVEGSAPIFDANWFLPDEKCGAKMGYSRAVLLEGLLIRRIFEGLKTKVHERIREKLNVPEGNTLEQGREVTPTGFQYTISDYTGGDDKYVNRFTVNMENLGSGICLTFNGTILMSKTIRQNMVTCDAETTVEKTVGWGGKLEITTAKDSAGNPTLSIKRTDESMHDPEPVTSKNACAEGYEIVREVVDFASWFTGLVGLVFGPLIDDLLKFDAPELASLENIFTSSPDYIPSGVLLPAGQVFFFKTPSVDKEANLYIQLEYKSEN